MPAWLTRSPYAAVLRALRSVAWADGSLDPAERELVQTLVGRLGVEVSTFELYAWLDGDRTGDDDVVAAAATEDQFGLRLVLSNAVRLASVDGNYSAEERERIAAWATAWGFSNAERTEIEDEVARELAAPKDPFA